MYSFTFKVKIFIKTVAIFIIQHFVDVHNWQIPYSFKIFERFNYFSRIYSFTFQHTFIHIQDQNVYSTQLLNSFNILCASLLLYLLETRGFEDTWIQSIVFQVSRWTLGIGHYLLLGGGGGGGGPGGGITSALHFSPLLAYTPWGILKNVLYRLVSSLRSPSPYSFI